MPSVVTDGLSSAKIQIIIETAKLKKRSTLYSHRRCLHPNTLPIELSHDIINLRSLYIKDFKTHIPKNQFADLFVTKLKKNTI